MYHLASSFFGVFERLSLYHAQSGNGFSIVPGFGACLLDLTLGGQPVLDVYTTPDLLLENYWGKNTLLFPFPNRLKNGQYEWQGRQYQFPINDQATGNALHGFGMDKPMRVEELLAEEQSAQIICMYSSRGEHPAYLFPFTFAISFLIEEPNCFSGEITFQNDGEQPIPVGFGWHPYFKIAAQIEIVSLQLPGGEKIEIDESMIPTGVRHPSTAFHHLEKIGNAVLDNCFALPANEGKAEVLIESKHGALHYWQETGVGKFNFLQIFTPPHRQSIAIEPMTCNINAFNNKEGLITLEPGQTASARFGLRFDKKES